MLVYLARSEVSGACYVGVTKRGLLARMSNHLADAQHRPRVPFHRAISEQGAEAFCWSVLADGLDQELAMLVEQEAIDKFQADIRHGGYNGNAGGGGCFEHTPETREKMARSHRALPPRSEETRRRLSVALKGRRPSPQCLAAGRRPKSAETRAKLSAIRVRIAAEKRAARPPKPPPESRKSVVQRSLATKRANGGAGWRLRDADRRPIVWLRAKGMTLKEIGIVFGCTGSAVGYFLQRGTK